LVIVSVTIVSAIAAIGYREISKTAASAPDAAATFNSKCAKCHGRDGRSQTFWGRRTHARDLSNGDWQNDVSDERLFNSISNGKAKMPSYKKSLTESEIDGLVNYVRRLRK
jgi:mono/diheme cytochrome c family protein